MATASCSASTYRIPGSRASPSISGSSVVPGLPNITETPSCLRSSRNACLPARYGIGPDDKLSCVSLPDGPFLRAARRAPVPYTPVWLMRQAGRYLPEYRAMRERFGFLELCRNTEAAAEVTLQPVDRLGVDAAILFADILLIVEPLDIGLDCALLDRPDCGWRRRRTDFRFLGGRAGGRRLPHVRPAAHARADSRADARRARHPSRDRDRGAAAAPALSGRRRDRARLASGPRRGLGERRPRRRGAREPRPGGAPRQAAVHPPARQRHPRPGGGPAGPHL